MDNKNLLEVLKPINHLIRQKTIETEERWERQTTNRPVRWLTWASDNKAWQWEIKKRTH